MNIKILPLSKKNIDSVISMVSVSLNSLEDDFDYAPLWYKASLEPKKLENKKLFEKFKVENLKYWVAIENNIAIGTIGLHEYTGNKIDQEEAFWVAWFVVDKNMRKKGIGTKLLKFIINKSKRAGKKYLRLYTQEDEEFLNAQKLYKKFGFVQFDSNYFDYESNHGKIIYFQLKLNE